MNAPNRAGDDRFAHEALAQGIIDEGDLAEVLAERRRLIESGQQLSMAQILLKLRKIGSQEFVVIQKAISQRTECPDCGMEVSVGDATARVDCPACGALVSIDERARRTTAPLTESPRARKIRTTEKRPVARSTETLDPPSGEPPRGEPKAARAGDSTRDGSRSVALPKASLPTVGEGADGIWGSYEILEEIARGGMGIVYKARQRAVGRTVALKILREGSTASDQQIARFEREAALVGRLRHPGIVSVHEAGIHEGLHYFSMDFVDGEPLDQRLTRDRPEVRESVRLLIEVARAVDYAHEHGVVHRDLKPGNILVDRSDRPLVTDFGLAKLVLDEDSDEARPTTLTQTGAAMGTPFYMSPEQSRGDAKDVDRRSDVFSLGVMLYEMLTGFLPFQARTRSELFRSIQEDDPPRPRALRKEIPVPLETICLKALEKDRGSRFPSAGELADDLERALAGESILARPIPAHVRLVRAVRRQRLLLQLVALGLVAAATAAGVLTLAGDPDPGPPPAAGPTPDEEPVDEWVVVHADEFERRELGEAWLPLAGTWEVRGNRLVARGIGEVAIRYAEQVTGDIILRYRARVLPRPVVSDLSSFLFGEEGHPRPWLAGYFVGFGSYFNQRSYVRRQSVLVWDSLDVLIDPGHWHQIEVSRIGNVVRLTVDGQVAMEYVDFFPVGGKDQSVLGLYTYDSEAEFDDVLIQRRKISNRAHPLEIADSLFRSGRFADAELRYEQFYQDNPDSEFADEARYKRALSKWQNDQPEIALEAFQSMAPIVQDPEMADRARLHVAQIHMAQERREECLLAIRDFLDQHPDRPGAVHFRRYLIEVAWNLFRLAGDPIASIPFWEEARHRFADDPRRRAWIHRHFLWAHLESKEFQEVLDAAEGVIAEHPDAAFEMSHVQLYVGIALAEKAEPDPAAALAALTATIERWPDEVVAPQLASNLIGDMLLASRDLEGALDSYRRTIDRYRHVDSRRTIHALLQSADILSQLGRLDDALGPCYQVLHQFGHVRDLCAESLIMQGRFHRAAGRTDQARQAWQRVLVEYGEQRGHVEIAEKELKTLE